MYLYTGLVKVIYLYPGSLGGTDVTLYVGVEHLLGLGEEDLYR